MFAAVALTSKAQYVFPITKDEPTKQFYTTIDIGAAVETPVNLLLDLGTNLTWSNCRKIKSLSSLRLVRCQSSTCKAIPGNGCDYSRNICLYQQPNPFGKNSSVTGRVVQDTATSSTVSFRPFTFSCAAAVKKTQGLPPPVAGILGLSTGEYSFWRQVTKKFNIIPQFALCLPSPGTTGNFYIGGLSYSVPSSATVMRVSSGEYFMVVESIYVDGTPLSLNPSLLNGGAKLSTVVPYTVLHTDIYNALAQAFTLKAKANGISQVPSVAPFKNCFDARAAAGKNMPVIEIGLPGNMREVRWTFHGTNTVVNINKKVICLAFTDGGMKPKENIVIGTYQLQNYYLTFDMSRTELRLRSDAAIWKVGDSICVKFSTKKVWQVLRMARPSVSWARFVWNQAIIPKHRITTWLFMLNRNPTMDRLISWGLDLENCCLLCGSDPESRDHLFFLCSYSTLVWKSVLGVFGITSPPLQWDSVLHWFESAARNHVQLAAILQLWHGAIYALWQERNARYHEGVTKTHWMLSREVIKQAKDKSAAMCNCGSELGLRLVTFWSET